MEHDVEVTDDITTSGSHLSGFSQEQVGRSGYEKTKYCLTVRNSTWIGGLHRPYDHDIMESEAISWINLAVAYGREVGTSFNHTEAV